MNSEKDRSDCMISIRGVSKHFGATPNAMDMISDGSIDLVINIPREYDELGRPDGYQIRRRAVEAGVPLVTDLELARALIEALRWRGEADLSVAPWQDYIARVPVALD